MYYSIEFLYSEEENGIYQHLPVTSAYTTDPKTAREWYEKAVRYHTTKYGNSLIYNKNVALDYNCRIAECKFKCSEPAYKEGFYLIELAAYHHNPVSD